MIATINTYLHKMGLTPTDADPYIYTRSMYEDQFSLCLYVDDILVASCKCVVIDGVKSEIAKSFKLKLRTAEFILGIQIYYEKETKLLQIGRDRYVNKVVRQFDQGEAKTSVVPIDARTILTKRD